MPTTLPTARNRALPIVHRLAVAFTVAAACMCAAHARAQIVLGGAAGGPSAVPVISSKDFSASLDAVGVDRDQRQMAETAFDDAQDRMFAAVRTFEDACRRADGTPSSVADVAHARRVQVQDLLGDVDSLFQQVSVVLRAEQHEPLDRERLAAKRRIMRAVLNEMDAGAAFGLDLEAEVAKSGATVVEKSAAFRALGPYRQRLAALMQQSIDRTAARQVKRERDDKRAARTNGAAGADGGVGNLRSFMEGQQEGRGDVAAVTREALKALEGTLPVAELEKVRRTALQRTWFRTGMDRYSPRRTFDALLAGKVPEAERAALEPAMPAIQAARETWYARWWSVTLRMTIAEDATLGTSLGQLLDHLGQGPDGTAGDDRAAKSRKAAEDFDALAAERRGIDRDAWKALAELDPDPKRRALEAGCVDADASKDGYAPPTELPGMESTGSFMLGGGDGGVGNGMVMISKAVEVGGPGSTDGAAAAGAAAAGAATAPVQVASTVTISVANAGEPIAFDLGEGGNLAFTLNGADGEFRLPDSAPTTGLAVRLPARIDRDEAAGIARALALDPANPALQAMLDDYAAKATEMDERLGAPFHDADHPNIAWLPDARAAQAPALLDAYVDGLAAVDDAFIAGIGAAAGASDATMRAAQDERAAARARATRYAVGVMGSTAPMRLCEVRLGDVVAGAGLSPADRSKAVTAWGPAATAVREAADRWRAATRTGDAEWLAVERRQMSAVQHMQGGNPQAMDVDPEDVKRIDAIAQAHSAAAKGMRAAVSDGATAIERTLSDEGRRAFRSAWYRAAVPKVYADPKDAMPALDAAFTLPSLTEAQRTQVNALRGVHAARHAEASDRLAETSIAAQSAGDNVFFFGAGDAGQRALALARFERQELDARSLRKLRTVLTPEQAQEVPSLRAASPAAAVSPAPTPPAPGRASP